MVKTSVLWKIRIIFKCIFPIWNVTFGRIPNSFSIPFGSRTQGWLRHQGPSAPPGMFMAMGHQPGNTSPQQYLALGRWRTPVLGLSLLWGLLWPLFVSVAVFRYCCQQQWQHSCAIGRAQRGCPWEDNAHTHMYTHKFSLSARRTSVHNNEISGEAAGLRSPVIMILNTVSGIESVPYETFR